MGQCWSVFIQKPQNKIFLKESITSILRLHVDAILRLHVGVTSHKKSEKFQNQFFIKLEKHDFGPTVGCFGQKSSEQDFFPKIQLDYFLS